LIDELCINQADNEKRGHQVNLMGQIYSEAAFVLLWPGRDTDRGSEVLNTGGPVRSKLDKNRYWTRLWIVQEIMLAKDIMVYYNLEWVEWELGPRAGPGSRMATLLTQKYRWKTRRNAGIEFSLDY
jgi:hypothetical protein